MAAFCSKCGAPLTAGTAFCSSCGAPVAATAPPIAAALPAQPVAAYGQQSTGYPIAPAKSSGGALKIILIVVAVVIAIGVVSAGAMGFMAWRVAKSVKVNDNGNGATMSLPGVGTLSAGDSVANDADLGVPAYPGATQEKGGMNLNSGSASMVMAHFVTSDSPSQVVDFYKSKMGEGTVSVDTGNGTVLNSGGQDTDRVMVTIGPGSGDDAGKTTIVVMHTKKK